jgi:hypothetical protein
MTLSSIDTDDLPDHALVVKARGSSRGITAESHSLIRQKHAHQEQGTLASDSENDVDMSPSRRLGGRDGREASERVPQASQPVDKSYKCGDHKSIGIDDGDDDDDDDSDIDILSIDSSISGLSQEENGELDEQFALESSRSKAKFSINVSERGGKDEAYVPMSTTVAMDEYLEELQPHSTEEDEGDEGDDDVFDFTEEEREDLLQKQVQQMKGTGDVMRVLNTFPNYEVAAKAMCVDSTSILRCCLKHGFAQFNGFGWRFKQESVASEDAAYDGLKDAMTEEEAIVSGAALGKPVEQIDDKTGEVIRVYPSGSHAARFVNASAAGISQVCRGVRERGYGFKWRFYTGPDIDCK